MTDNQNCLLQLDDIVFGFCKHKAGGSGTHPWKPNDGMPKLNNVGFSDASQEKVKEMGVTKCGLMPTEVLCSIITFSR